MHELGIKNGLDLKQHTEMELVRHFGKAGTMYYQFARGVDEREVESEYVRKSLGAEETFAEDLHEIVDLLRALDDIAREVHRRADKKGFLAKTLTLKIKYADFTVVTRSKTVGYFLRTYDQLFDLGKELLLQIDDIEERKIRLMGLTLKNAGSDQTILTDHPVQLAFEFKE
ncbi:DNA polymerase IV 1 [bioreactor metagenome]|uniref:DNA-directed DNA polymerase n=1 Tax=bioreactor metagenome TaxID=1076179 RepID=A0A645B6H7_9ZZZZ